MKDFPKELKIQIAQVWNGYCAYPLCLNHSHSIHHMLPNTKYNQKKFPLLVQSPMNGIPLCEHHHRENAHEYKITPQQAQLYEKWLEDNICKCSGY